MSLRPTHPLGFAEQFVLEHPLNRVRFEAAQALLDAGAHLVDETGRESLAGAPFILTMQATRATHTFESVIVLCRIGRGVAAAMLNRSLLEDALDVHWVAANPDAAPELAAEHDRAIELAERAMEERFGRPVVPLSDAEREELAKLQKRYNNFRLSWNRASEPDRIQLVKERWGEGAGEQLDYVYEVIQRRNNALIHGSPTGYRQVLVPRVGGKFIINRIGPDTRWLDSLGHGVLGYYFVCKVVAEEFGFDIEPAKRAFHQASCLVKKHELMNLEGAGPSDECPCGSGRRFHACHGL